MNVVKGLSLISLLLFVGAKPVTPTVFYQDPYHRFELLIPQEFQVGTETKYKGEEKLILIDKERKASIFFLIDEPVVNAMNDTILPASAEEYIALNFEKPPHLKFQKSGVFKEEYATIYWKQEKFELGDHLEVWMYFIVKEGRCLRMVEAYRKGLDKEAHRNALTMIKSFRFSEEGFR
jgi:hypothetical protein